MIFIPRTLILILLSSASFFCSGQFTIETSRIYGGNSLDEARDIAVSSDSSRIFMGGRSFSSDEDVPSNAGGSDFWITKWNIDGTQIWNKTFGGFNNDDLTNVLPHTDGGVFGFGTTRDDQGDNGDLKGFSGGWLIRLGQSGNIIQGRIFGGTISETAVDAIRHPSGNLTMAMQATSPVLDGKTNHGVTDVWIVNVDPVMNDRWSVLLGGTLEDSPAAIATDPNNNIYVVATSSSDLTGLSPNAGGQDVWVFKLSSQGNLVWQKKFGGSGDDIASDILYHPDGFVYVTAHSTSNDGDFNINFGSNDLWLIKLDINNGSPITMTQYGGEDNDQDAHLERLDSNQLIITATSGSSGFNLTGNKGLNDVWLFSTDLNGTILHQMNYGGSLQDLGGDVIVIDHVIHLLNTSQSSDKNVPLNALSQRDLWYLTLNTRPIPCSDQLKCIPDSTLDNEILPPSNNGIYCKSGCNSGLDPGPFFNQGQCTNFGNATAFYKLTTDSTADLITLSVASNEMNQPQIALLAPGGCSTFTPIRCASGMNGFVLIEYIEIAPLTTYLIAISDAEGNEGKFNFCMTSLNVEFCNKSDLLYATHTSFGSPLHGPYLPGEDVQFCYELLDWTKLDCNGFQGLVPSFGPGWDPGGFTVSGMPVQVDSLLSPHGNGFWDWYAAGQVRYNFSNPIIGFDANEAMPAGWYFRNLSDLPPNDGPDETTGDSYTCLPTLDKWKVCFTLHVLEECDRNLDASVSMHTFSDGEIGSRLSNACIYDQNETFTARMACCLNPGMEFINDVTMCSEDTVSLQPQTNILPPVTYSWIAYPENGIEGSSSRNNAQRFFQILTNESNSPLKVHYVLWAEGVDCRTDSVEFDVNVLPLPSARISLSGPSAICSGSNVSLNFECMGTPPFAIELYRDNEFFGHVLSEETFLTIDVDPVFSSRFRIGKVTDAFCEGDGLGVVNVNVKPVGSSIIDTTICEGNFVVVGTQVISDPGVHTITLTNAAANHCDSIVSLTLTIVPSETETVVEEICNGDTVFILGIPYTDSTDELISYIGPAGCTQYIHLLLTVRDTFFAEIDQTICAGDTLNFGGIKVFRTGSYAHVEETSPGCFERTTLNLTVLPAIFINDLSVIGDDGSGNGAILVELIGGSPPFTFLWSSGQTTESLFKIMHGHYVLTVTDDHGCRETFTFDVPMVTGIESVSETIQEVRIWPSIVPAGENITVFNPAGSPVHLRKIEWWDVSGHLISSETHPENPLPVSVKAPGKMSGNLCFARIISSSGRSSWFRIVIQ